MLMSSDDLKKLYDRFERVDQNVWVALTELKVKSDSMAFCDFAVLCQADMLCLSREVIFGFASAHNWPTLSAIMDAVVMTMGGLALWRPRGPE